MKKHNIFKVVLITMLVMFILTWICPAASYSSEFADEGLLQMGLTELLNYPMETFYYFGRFAIFVILVGGFYGVLYKIPAYRTFLDKIVKVFEGKEMLFLAIASVLLACGVSFAGLHLALVVFIPFVISLILLMGYDKIVAAMTVVGSMAAGFIGLTYSTSNTSILTSTLKLDYDYQIGVRIVLLLVALVLVLFNIYMYIKNHGTKKIVEKEVKPEVKKEEVVVTKVEVKKTTTKSSTAKKSSSSAKSGKNSSKKKSSSKSGKSANKAALRDEEIIVVKESVTVVDDDKYLVPNRVESGHKIWPFVVFFVLMFALLILGFVNWGEDGFGLKVFEDATQGFLNYKLFGFPIFAKIYGSVSAFGTWNVLTLIVPLTLVLLLLVIIYNISLDDMFDGFIEGAKKALAPALIFILVYTVLVITTYHPFQMTIYHFLLGKGPNLNIVTTMLVTLLSAVFNVDPMYSFQAVLPYYISVVTKVDNYSLTGIIAQSMYGFAVLFAPTSYILMCVLSYLKVGYVEWLKSIWKLLLELFVVLLIVFIILAVI